MTTHRTVARTTAVDPQPGTGILHPFPTGEIAHLDPFVFLDTGAPRNLGAGDIYVGPHSHRGVQPVSLLFRGRIEHRDSLGNHREIGSGGMQWLVAGSGAMHEEVLHGDDDGVFHMAQLWVNVPARLKMAPPEHHAVGAEHVPVVEPGPGVTMRVYAGSVDGVVGPAPLPTPVLVGHVAIAAGGRADLAVPAGWTAAFTVVAGAVTSGDSSQPAGTTVVFADDGDTIPIASDRPAELLVMAGEPIGEPVAMGGGFVMNTADEIRAAFDDERAGRFGELLGSR